MNRALAPSLVFALLLTASAQAAPPPAIPPSAPGIPASRTITAGAGLQGGGDLSENRSFSLSEELCNSGAAITGTTYSVDLSDDMAKQCVFTGSSASAWDDTGTATSGGFDIVNAGTADVTWTPTDGIDGGSSIVVPSGSWAHFFFDGTTWRSEPGKNLSGVTAGTYGDSTHCVSVTVDKYGRLTAASQSTSCPGGSAGITSNYVANNWYNWANAGAGTGVNFGNTVIEWSVRYFDRAVTIGNLGGRISTTSASSNFQMALYAANSSGLPTGSALCSTGDISGAASGSYNAACSYAVTTPGFYWVGTMVSDATLALVSIVSQSAPYANSVIGASSQANLSGSTSFFGTEYKTTGQTYGTWPTNPTITQAGQSGATTPVVQFKVTSVP